MEDDLNVGDTVEKTGGDYTFRGEVRAGFYKRSGAVRYVVENEAGILHIFNRKQLTKVESGGGSMACENCKRLEQEVWDKVNAAMASGGLDQAIARTKQLEKERDAFREALAAVVNMLDAMGEMSHEDVLTEPFFKAQRLLDET